MIKLCILLEQQDAAAGLERSSLVVLHPSCRRPSTLRPSILTYILHPAPHLPLADQGSVRAPRRDGGAVGWTRAPAHVGYLLGFLQALRSLRLGARRGGGSSSAVWWGVWGRPTHGACVTAHLSGLMHLRVPRHGLCTPVYLPASVCQHVGWHVRGGQHVLLQLPGRRLRVPWRSTPGNAPNEFSAALHIKQPHEKVFFSPIFIQCPKHATPAPHPCKHLVHSCSFKRTKGEGGGAVRCTRKPGSALGLPAITLLHPGGAETPWTQSQLCHPGMPMSGRAAGICLSRCERHL